MTESAVAVEMTESVVAVEMTESVVAVEMTESVVASQDIPQDQLETVLLPLPVSCAKKYASSTAGFRHPPE